MSLRCRMLPNPAQQSTRPERRAAERQVRYPMSRSDIEQVLRNWIDQAISPDGTFPEGTDRAAWVADNFIAWWRKRVDDSLGSAELAACRLRDELTRLGHPHEFDDALHELTHIQDALSDLRNDLGLSGDAATGD